MNFNKIDMESWDRVKTYRHFMSDVPCTYSMCVNLDISRFLPVLKSNTLKIFPAVLYGLSYIVNKHKEFRMDTNGNNELGYYDVTDPCYTVFHENTESFIDVWTSYDEDFTVLYSRYLADVKEYGNPNAESKPLQGNNIFYVSCIPWTSFTGFNLNLKNGYDYLQPIFTIGKYFEADNKILLPLAIQLHHAVCDGFHAARFVNELQTWMDNFS